MREYVELLPAINAMADASPGFVWRLQTEDGDATAVRVYDDPLVPFNMSVWAGLAELRGYVYRSSHTYALRRRGDWFERVDPPSVMWWVPAGHRPHPPEGRARLERLAAEGPRTSRGGREPPAPRLPGDGRTDDAEPGAAPDRGHRAGRGR
jgi:hypothetical protein